jgi:uncharacterized protein YsxB (DUF464 family)
VWPAVVAHAANNGVASVIAVSGHADPTAEKVDVASAATLLAFGVAALIPLLAAFRHAAPAPPPVEEAVALRDPRDGSVAFRVHRVPNAIFAAAMVGAALLFAIAVKYPIRELREDLPAPSEPRVP